MNAEVKTIKTNAVAVNITATGGRVLAGPGGVGLV